MLIVAVKPQDIEPLLRRAGRRDHPGHAGGLAVRGTADLAVRAAPAGRHAGGPGHAEHADAGRRGDERDLGRLARRPRSTCSWCEDLLSTVGKVVRVPEAQQDAVTALSGSGPAYFFFLVEAMIDAGILLGLPRAVSTELIIQSAVGAAKMLRESGEHPVALREAVTSPGGTTIAAIRELENHRVRAALLSAIEAAALRSAELGKAHD